MPTTDSRGFGTHSVGAEGGEQSDVASMDELKNDGVARETAETHKG